MWSTEFPRHNVREGGAMLCHAGTSAYSHDWQDKVREYRPCVGALVVQQREALRYHDQGDSYDSDNGMTIAGIERVVRRMLNRSRLPLQSFRGLLTRDVVLRYAHPAITDAEVDIPFVDAPAPGEFEL